MVSKATQVIRSCRAQPCRSEACRYPTDGCGSNGQRGDKTGSDGSPSKGENWFKQAISDENGQADMAYLVVGALAAAALGAITFVMGMSLISYIRCTKIVDVGQGTRASIACIFDPLPVGQAAGLIFGAFAALIGAFAGYMAATRRRPIVQQPQPQMTATASVSSP